MRPAKALPLLTCALLLAGCAGGGGAADAPGTGGGPGAPDGAAGATVLRFAGLDDPVDAVVWANGTVAFQDTCNTGGCVMGTERAYRATDLTDQVPAGVPVEITAAFTTEPGPLFGTFDLFLDAPDSVIYYHRATVDHAAGTGLVQAMLLREGRVAMVLGANAPGGEVPETPYTLSASIVAGPERVPPGAPVGVELGPGSNLTFAAPGQADPGFLLYGPDDAFLGAFAGHVALPAGAPRGEYVVLVPNGAQWGNLSSDTATSMRALGLVGEEGPAGTLAPTGAYEATWDVTGVPFAIGFFVHPEEVPPVGGPLVSAGFEITMAGDNGVRVESGRVCGFCLTFGLRMDFGSGTGDPDVVAQTYTLTGTTELTYDLRVVPFAVRLDRSR